MKKFILGTAVVMAYGQFALAFPLLPDWHHATKDKSAQSQSKQDSAGQCTDFTGNWKGTCTNKDGAKIEKEVKIKQTGCEMLQANDMTIPIGGFISLTGSTAPKADNTSDVGLVSVSLDWNKDKTQIDATAGVLVRELGGKNGVEKMVFNKTFEEVMKLDGDKLVANVTSADAKEVVNCELAK